MAVTETNMWRVYANHYTPYFSQESGTERFKFSIIAKEQPEYVCMDCANEYSYWRALGHGLDKGAKFSPQVSHTGTCDCCGQKEFSLYKLKDVGYFYKGWQNRKLRVL
jgi:Zn finger protein HypA/HybF involved in hydrogenase expression